MHASLIMLLVLSFYASITTCAHQLTSQEKAQQKAEIETERIKKAIAERFNSLQQGALKGAPVAGKMNAVQNVPLQADPQAPIELLEEMLKAFRNSVDCKKDDSEPRLEDVMRTVRAFAPTIKTMKNSQQQTPLMLCTRYGCAQAIDELLTMGAGLSDKDGAGKTAFVYSCEQHYTTLLAKLGIKMKKEHQPELLEAMKFAPSIEIVDQIWDFLDEESRIQLAEQNQAKNPLYKNISKAFPTLRKQRKMETESAQKIPQLGKDVMQHFATPVGDSTQEQAKIAKQQETQKRRKERKKLKAQEEAAAQALKMQQKKEADELTHALAEKKRIENERLAMLEENALMFQEDHALTRRNRQLKDALSVWKTHVHLNKQDEERAKKHAQKKDAQHKRTLKQKTFKAWHQKSKKLTSLHKKAEIFAERKTLRSYFSALRALRLQKQAPFSMRLQACANSLALLAEYEQKKATGVDSLNAHDRARINLLLSASSVIGLYAKSGYTFEEFAHSTKILDVQCKKLLTEVGQKIAKEYSFKDADHMVLTLFNNAQAKKDHDEQDITLLFDAVRVQNTQRVSEIMQRVDCDHECYLLFKDWLQQQIKEHNAIPADAMVNGQGAQTFMGWLHMEKKYEREIAHHSADNDSQPARGSVKALGHSRTYSHTPAKDQRSQWRRPHSD